MAGLQTQAQALGKCGRKFQAFFKSSCNYCIQACYRDLRKNHDTEKKEYYREPQLEISLLRSWMPDEALQVIRYTTEPQISEADGNKPWLWMDKLCIFYTGTIRSSLLTDRFRFWGTTVQDWEVKVKVRQVGSLCDNAALTDEMCGDKFVFGLHDSNIRTELLKTHLKSDNTNYLISDVVNEAKALASQQAN